VKGRAFISLLEKRFNLILLFSTGVENATQSKLEPLALLR
jgi:hypothetical protein